jgi:NAD(P)-dependent dehydrogenase (short-subunit alcohol dehydrogenase family)
MGWARCLQAVQGASAITIYRGLFIEARSVTSVCHKTAIVHAMFYLTKAAVPHMTPGSAIINTASVNSDMPNPILLAYATTKGAIQNFTGGLAQMLAGKGIRVNAVAPGPIWTPLIPSTMPEEAVKNFGKQVPMKRAGQPAELATAYVMLADPLSSYTSGTTVAVTGGKPFI